MKEKENFSHVFPSKIFFSSSHFSFGGKQEEDERQLLPFKFSTKSRSLKNDW